MAEINNEIGLTAILRSQGEDANGSDTAVPERKEEEAATGTKEVA